MMSMVKKKKKKNSKKGKERAENKGSRSVAKFLVTQTSGLSHRKINGLFIDGDNN